MKSFRWTFIFAGLVAIVVAFTIYDFRHSSEKKEQSEKAKAVVRFPTAEISRFEIVPRGGQEATVVEKTGEKWRVMAPEKDLADSQAIDAFLSSLAAERTIETVADGSFEPKTYGLDDPVGRLRINAGAGQSQEIKIGSVKAYDGSLYAQINDEKRVTLVASTWDANIAKRSGDFRDKHALRTEIKAPELSRIDIDRRGRSFSVVKTGESWRITGPNALAYPVSGERVASFLDQMKGVRIHQFMSGEAAAKAKSRLTQPDVSIAIYTSNKKDPVFRLRFLPEEKFDKLTSRSVGSSDLSDPGSITKAIADNVIKAEQDFYDKKLPFHFAGAEIDRVEVESPQVKARFAKNGETWTIINPGLQKEADGPKLNELIEKLGRLEAVRVLEPVRSRVWIGNKGETRVALFKKNAPEFEIFFGEPRTEKKGEDHPEAKVIPVRTNKSDHVVAVTEGELKRLDLGSLIKSPPVQAVSSQAGKTSTPPPR